MRDARGERDELVEDSGLELDGEEFSVMREECRIQIAFDRGQVEGVIFEAGVISHDEEGEDGE